MIPGPGTYRGQQIDASLSLMYLSLTSSLSKSNEKMSFGEDEKKGLFLGFASSDINIT